MPGDENAVNSCGLMAQTRFPFGRFVLAMLLVSIALWAVMIYGTLAHLRQLAGGIEPFDVRPFGYSVPLARALLDALGDGGRDFYAHVQLRIDLIYPATYALSRGGIIWWLTEPGRLRDAAIPLPTRIALLVLPAAAAVFDYGENIQIGRMLSAGPNVDAAVIETASRLTTVKSLCSAASEVAVLTLAMVVFLRWRRRSR